MSSFSIQLLTDSGPLELAIEELRQVASKHPEDVLRFLAAMGEDTDLVEIRTAPGREGHLGKFYILLLPSDRFQKFLWAIRSGASV